MAGIEEAMDRLALDPNFRDALHRDPRAALDGYDLSADDLERLAGQLMTDVEPKSGRPSKAALLDLLRDRAGN